ncbi:phosphoribosylanthranilate isomerase [Pedobacter sp. SYSU D00535]|uniref:phosphoribosylanthranilate isomerase n=1 Tax=Pedobacter sp. SYSU D00535 TaxID=2810308 RepID=UPI001A963710|nr:phosphoribosylanthranilate isomerase [Pedobacter sp. SYSU D00535]
MREPSNINDLANLRPDYMGFIFYPASKRFVEALDLETLAHLPSSIKKTGVFVNSSLAEVEAKAEEFKLDALQLHGQESPEFCSVLKNKGFEVIKAFGVDPDFQFTVLDSYTKAVDYFLFDTKTVAHGGSGETFNWSLLTKYQLNVPYFLSGGLSAENVLEVITLDDDRLYAVDLNSRFEVRPGLKNIELLGSVIDKLKQAHLSE